jgi:hypothetical protein
LNPPGVICSKLRCRMAVTNLPEYLSGEDLLANYQFHRGIVQHSFCKIKEKSSYTLCRMRCGPGLE